MSEETHDRKEDRTRSVIDSTSKKADEVAKKLWFLDLKFEQFATPRLIGVVFLLWMVVLAISFVGLVLYAIATLPVWLAAAITIGHLLGSIISAVLVRVGLEAFLVIFRISEHLENLEYLKEITISTRERQGE